MTFKAPKLPDGWVWEVNIVKTDWEETYRADIKAVETATGKFYLQRIQFNVEYDSANDIKDLFLLAAEKVCDGIAPTAPTNIFEEIVNAFNEA